MCYCCYSVLGDEVVGIWPENAKRADVNCAHLSNTCNALATGDDNGLVKLFQFPASKRFVRINRPFSDALDIPLTIESCVRPK